MRTKKASSMNRIGLNELAHWLTAFRLAGWLNELSLSLSSRFSWSNRFPTLVALLLLTFPFFHCGSRRCGHHSHTHTLFSKTDKIANHWWWWWLWYWWWWWCCCRWWQSIDCFTLKYYISFFQIYLLLVWKARQITNRVWTKFVIPFDYFQALWCKEYQQQKKLPPPSLRLHLMRIRSKEARGERTQIKNR